MRSCQKRLVAFIDAQYRQTPKRVIKIMNEFIAVSVQLFPVDIGSIHLQFYESLVFNRQT